MTSFQNDLELLTAGGPPTRESLRRLLEADAPAEMDARGVQHPPSAGAA